jgi:hypothetical protein
MPDFARAHASEARRQVSIAEHHEAKMKRAQALTSQHHIKTVCCRIYLVHKQLTQID